MTPYVLRHHDVFRSSSLVTCFPKIVIQNGDKDALWERRKTEQWHGVKNLWLSWQLTAFLTTVIDPSHSLRMTFNVLCHYDALPYPVIQNGDKDALWERRKTEQWHGVKNLLPWWRLTGFLTTGADPSHSFRMTPFVLRHSDAFRFHY